MDWMLREATEIELQREQGRWLLLEYGMEASH
jgi:hypothetical protein